MADKSKRRSFIGLAAFLGGVFVAMIIGGLATSIGMGPWYEVLPKPFWTPPEWVFGPVWTVLYAMMGVAAWLVWRDAGFAGARVGLTLFFVQLVVNVAWPVLFFGFREFGWASLDIVVLLALILATTRAFLDHSRVAALLLLPYAVWVGYAASITIAVWFMQPGEAATGAAG